LLSCGIREQAVRQGDAVSVRALLLFLGKQCKERGEKLSQVDPRENDNKLGLSILLHSMLPMYPGLGIFLWIYLSKLCAM